MVDRSRGGGWIKKNNRKALKLGKQKGLRYGGVQNDKIFTNKKKGEKQSKRKGKKNQISGKRNLVKLW